MKRYYYCEMILGEMYVETQRLSTKEVRNKLTEFWGDEPTRFESIVKPPDEYTLCLNLDHLED